MSQKTMPPEVQAAMIQVAGRWAALNIQNKYPEPLYGERLFTELGESFEWALTVLAQRLTK